jgi:hypothetical protein
MAEPARKRTYTFAEFRWGSGSSDLNPRAWC